MGRSQMNNLTEMVKKVEQEIEKDSSTVAGLSSGGWQAAVVPRQIMFLWLP